jgi:hypothetical protein
MPPPLSPKSNSATDNGFKQSSAIDYPNGTIKKTSSILTDWLKSKRDQLFSSKPNSQQNLVTKTENADAEENNSGSYDSETSEDQDSSDDDKPLNWKKKSQELDNVSINVESSSSEDDNAPLNSKASVRDKISEAFVTASHDNKQKSKSSLTSIASRSGENLPSNGSLQYSSKHSIKKSKTSFKDSKDSIAKDSKNSSRGDINETKAKSEVSLSNIKAFEHESESYDSDSEKDSANENEIVNTVMIPSKESVHKKSYSDCSDDDDNVDDKELSDDDYDDSDDDRSRSKTPSSNGGGSSSPRGPRRSIMMMNGASNRSTGTIPEENSDEERQLQESNDEDAIEVFSHDNSQVSSKIGSTVGLNRATANSQPIIVQSKPSHQSFSKNTGSAKSDESFEISELSDGSDVKTSDSNDSLSRPSGSHAL